MLQLIHILNISKLRLHYVNLDIFILLSQCIYLQNIYNFEIFKIHINCDITFEMFTIQAIMKCFNCNTYKMYHKYAHMHTLIHAHNPQSVSNLIYHS